MKSRILLGDYDKLSDASSTLLASDDSDKEIHSDADDNLSEYSELLVATEQA